MFSLALVSLAFTYARAAEKWEEVYRSGVFVFDIGTNSEDAAYAAGFANGAGPLFLKGIDKFTNWSIDDHPFDFVPFGCSSLGRETASVLAILGHGYYTLDGGNEWRQAASAVFGAQNIVRSRSDEWYGAASGADLHISTDKGITYTPHRGTFNLSRFASIPSDDVWYVATGEFYEPTPAPSPFTYADAIEIKTNKPWLSYIYSKENQHMEAKIHFRRQKKVKQPQNKRKLLQSDMPMWTEMWRTSNAGQSWTRQYSAQHTFYFNQVDCCNANVCYAAGEGAEENGSDDPGSRILKTVDGGQNWEIMYHNSNDASSMMTIKCINETTAIAAGGIVEQGDFGGEFWRTDDGGQTWNLTASVKAVIIAMDMTNDGKIGVAAGLSKAQEGVIYAYRPDL